VAGLTRRGPRWTAWPIGGKVFLMADVGYIAIVVAGFGAYWWRHMRPIRARNYVRELFTSDAEVALHVATHEATARRQELSSVHVLYGLLQDEAITGAITTSGGDPAALEDRVLDALGSPAAFRDASADEDGQVVRRAAAISQRSGRTASCTDLWAFLGDSRAAELLEEAKLDRRATLFALVHGGREPDVTLPDERDVFVVLRNDHYTTQEFVASALQRVFALPEGQAAALMLATHETGRAVIGRFTAAAARVKIDEMRTLARTHAFPLWIGVEPA
jgi:ATP-dependent Clp protease adaptor protein ClpS